MQRNPAEERRQRRISHESPREMPCIVQRRQFVPVESVAVICPKQKQNSQSCDDPRQRCAFCRGGRLSVVVSHINRAVYDTGISGELYSSGTSGRPISSLSQAAFRGGEESAPGNLSGDEKSRKEECGHS